MKKRIEKGRVARCPYCGRVINYFYLYDSRHYDYGHCSHCGGVYAVRNSGLMVLLAVLAFLLIAGNIVVYIIENGELPSIIRILQTAGALLVLYGLLPFTVEPTKLSVNGRIGGFPNQNAMPERLRREMEEKMNSEEWAENLKENAKEMFVGFDFPTEEENQPETVITPEASEIKETPDPVIAAEAEKQEISAFSSENVRETENPVPEAAAAISEEDPEDDDVIRPEPPEEAFGTVSPAYREISEEVTEKAEEPEKEPKKEKSEGKSVFYGISERFRKWIGSVKEKFMTASAKKSEKEPKKKRSEGKSVFYGISERFRKWIGSVKEKFTTASAETLPEEPETDPEEEELTDGRNEIAEEPMDDYVREREAAEQKNHVRVRRMDQEHLLTAEERYRIAKNRQKNRH